MPAYDVRALPADTRWRHNFPPSCCWVHLPVFFTPSASVSVMWPACVSERNVACMRQWPQYGLPAQRNVACMRQWAQCGLPASVSAMWPTCVSERNVACMRQWAQCGLPASVSAMLPACVSESNMAYLRQWAQYGLPASVSAIWPPCVSEPAYTCNMTCSAVGENFVQKKHSWRKSSLHIYFKCYTKFVVLD